MQMINYDKLLLFVDVPAKTANLYSFWGNDISVKNGSQFPIRVEVTLPENPGRLCTDPQGNESLLALLQGEWFDIVDEEDFVGIADQLYAEEMGW